MTTRANGLNKLLPSIPWASARAPWTARPRRSASSRAPCLAHPPASSRRSSAGLFFHPRPSVGAGPHTRLGRKPGRTALVASHGGGPHRAVRMEQDRWRRTRQTPKGARSLASLPRETASPLPASPRLATDGSINGGRLPLSPRPGRRSSDIQLGFRGSATLSAGRRAIEEWLASVRHADRRRPRTGAVRRRGFCSVGGKTFGSPVPRTYFVQLRLPCDSADPASKTNPPWTIPLIHPVPAPAATA